MGVCSVIAEGNKCIGTEGFGMVFHGKYDLKSYKAIKLKQVGNDTKVLK